MGRRVNCSSIIIKKILKFQICQAQALCMKVCGMSHEALEAHE
jgi:hypothetical protein